MPLVIDDCQQRKNVYMDDVRPCPFFGWDVVRTIADMKEYLAQDRVARCSLDHDMGACAECVAQMLHIGDMLTPETTFFNRCPHTEDGSSLVRWMIETNHWPVHKPLVHSMNPDGARRMRELIDRYGPY